MTSYIIHGLADAFAMLEAKSIRVESINVGPQVLEALNADEDDMFLPNKGGGSVGFFWGAEVYVHERGLREVFLNTPHLRLLGAE